MTPQQIRIKNLALAEKEICPRSHWPTDKAVYQNIVDAWCAGLRGDVPESLRKFETEDARRSDPEFAEYQRLARKFE